jgi:hypothetical protein
LICRHRISLLNASIGHARPNGLQHPVHTRQVQWLINLDHGGGGGGWVEGWRGREKGEGSGPIRAWAGCSMEGWERPNGGRTNRRCDWGMHQPLDTSDISAS